MKKAAVFGIIFLFTSFIYAQNSVYISPIISEGFSSTSVMTLHPYGAHPGSYVFSQQYRVNAGISKGNWQFESGLGFLTTGLSFNSSHQLPPIVNIYPIPEPTPVDKSKSKDIRTHIVLPLSFCYKINIGNKFSFIPGAGVEALYNSGNKITSNNPGFSQRDYSNPFHENPLSGALLLKTDLEYRINKKLSIICGPSAQCMFTSLTAKVPGESMSRVYDYSYLMNVGLKYNITKRPHKVN